MSEVHIENLPLLGTQIKLNNGCLVVALGGSTSATVFLVTSFRNNTGCHAWENTKAYCSLVRLDNGYIAFEEPCSRVTNANRVLRHLNNFSGHCQYTGLQVIQKDNYSLNIEVDKTVW